MDNPQISVIVPVYNAEKYLHRCIDSILAQTFTDFELLLIDDGSKDKSGAICDEYAVKDNRVRVFHKENGGVSSARNVGLDNARGEWITFSDSDDYAYPEWLSNFYSCHTLEKYDVINQGLRCSKAISDPSNDSEISYTCNVCESNIASYCETLFHTGILGYLFIKLFRRSIIESHRIRFNEKIKLREDLVFFLEYCSCCNRLGISIEEIGYYYFVPDWSKKYIFDEESSITYYRQAFNCIKKFGIDLHSELRREIREGYVNLLMKLFKDSYLSRQKKLLLEIKEILRTDIEVCQMNGLLKFIIRYDLLKSISLYCLKLYCKLR